MTKENQSLGGNMEEQECEVLHEETVQNVKKQMLDEDILFDVSDFFKMLGDSTRSKIMWALDKHEMCVCDLAALLGKIGRASVGKECVRRCRSRWSPYH